MPALQRQHQVPRTEKQCTSTPANKHKLKQKDLLSEKAKKPRNVSQVQKNQCRQISTNKHSYYGEMLIMQNRRCHKPLSMPDEFSNSQEVSSAD